MTTVLGGTPEHTQSESPVALGSLGWLTKWLLQQQRCANNDGEEDEQQCNANEPPPYQAGIRCSQSLTGTCRGADVDYPHDDEEPSCATVVQDEYETGNERHGCG